MPIDPLPVCKRKRARQPKPPRPRLRFELENQLACKFERSRILHTIGYAKVASSDVVVEVIELGVVEGVERLATELKPCALGNRKRLVKVRSEVGTAGTYNDVPTRIAEAQVRATVPALPPAARNPAGETQ